LCGMATIRAINLANKVIYVFMSGHAGALVHRSCDKRAPNVIYAVATDEHIEFRTEAQKRCFMILRYYKSNVDIDIDVCEN